ncbi:hypothetical protein BCR44DRAFT_1451098 [Catenaria anguillulae PL171]|uniref:Signal recognition particle receptor subunit beta n=1 Tax=Catenaria anguillulae PL171 TaxID=765915 RepID=A0A1Y2H4D2_9FUNG|nr:hypothetical protein BCR44DRAFT_1451098 [Catenaria anguillulae PL171]
MTQIEIEPSTLAIATLILALLISIAIAVWQRSSAPSKSGSRKSKSKSISSTVAVIGAPNAGKSALFAKLTAGSFPSLPTYSSMATNQSPLPLAAASHVAPTLIDCPGHSRLLAETHKHLDRNPRVTLVAVDATALAATKRDAAERLALALDHRTLPGMGVIVVATKADNPLAMPVSAVKAALAEEVHVLRLAQEAQLGTTDDVDGHSDEDEDDASHLRVRRKGALAGKGKGTPEAEVESNKQSLDDLDVKVLGVSAKSGKGIEELMTVIRQAFGVATTTE